MLLKEKQPKPATKPYPAIKEFKLAILLCFKFLNNCVSCTVDSLWLSFFQVYRTVKPEQHKWL